MKAKTCSYHYLLWIQILTCSISSFVVADNKTEKHRVLQTIIHQIQKLPEKSQPKDIRSALSLIIAGESVWNYARHKKYYQALNIAKIDSKEARIVQQALDIAPDKFWRLISQDKAVHNEIELCNIPFNHDNCTNTKYTMLFRMAYLKANIKDEKVLHDIVQAYQHAIICLQWFLFGQALLQYDAFTSGMITIPDKHLYIFHFIDGYAELVSPRYRLYSGLHPHSLWQSKAYTRTSRHWPNKKIFNDQGFGIDFFKPDNSLNPILPGNNAHVLFGALDNGLSFVTWKPFGTTINFKEKNFTALKHPMQFFTTPETKSTSVYRKEKVPNDVMLQFKSLFNQNLTKHQATRISKDGITAMLTMLEHDAKKLFESFLINFKKYPEKTLRLRKGNEIIIDPAKIVTIQKA